MTSPSTRTGLQRLVDGDAGKDLRNQACGLVIHPASVTSDLTLAVDALLERNFRIEALFGPQHGARGEKQDNMIESGHYADPGTGLPVHSLYSEVRKPTAAMLEGLDVVLFDLQDVGVRVYTFVWTMALAMEACAEAGVRFVVLDRPNPVGGTIVEGPLLRAGYESFVGLHPIPLRHGLTAGELAMWLNQVRGIGCDLDVISMEGWRRDMWWEDTGLPWVPPSPNLPTPDSCVVYPGAVLVEGTNLSEGRGTTRPFEMVGAPYLDAEELARRLSALAMPGVTFRACWFEPTFQKHAGDVCEGVQVHVTDRCSFRPVRWCVELFGLVRELAPGGFAWRPPPYEYEQRLMPIDILWGHPGLREGIDAGLPTDDILSGVADEVADFAGTAAPFLLY